MFGKTLCQLAKSNTRQRREGRTWERRPPPRPWAAWHARFFRAHGTPNRVSCSRAQVLRRCLRGARLRSTVDAQALIEVSRIHADLNRIGGGMEQLASLCLSRAATTQAEVSPPARPERHRQGAVSQAENAIRVARPSPRSKSWRGRTDSRCRPTGNPSGSSTR